MGRFLFLFLIVFNSMIIGKTILLDFEDRTLDETLNIQYQSKYGITFDGGVKVVDKSANLDKIPSGSNAIRLEKNNFFDINVPKGFSGALSFYYTSATHKGTVSIQDTKGGKTIAIRDLPSVGSKKYNDWKLVIIKFSKTAKFIRFYAQDNRIAFDNITLGTYTHSQDIFDIKLSLAKSTPKNPSPIYHQQRERLSNKFTIMFNSDKDICALGEYTFKIEDLRGKEAKLVICDYNNTNDIAKVQFVLIKKDNKNYIENADVSLCEISSGKCVVLNFITNFTVYGTEFDIKKDAFSFENGDQYHTIINGNIGPLGKITQIIIPHLTIKEQSYLYNTIGWRSYKDIKLIDSHVSEGLCHGMIQSAIAQYNHKPLSPWGVGNTFSTAINSRWDTANSRVNESDTSYKPYDSNRIYEYAAKDIESFKKILYYYVDQAGIAGATPSSWVGKYKDSHSFGNLTQRHELKNILKHGSPFNMGMYLYDINLTNYTASADGGHSVAVTQYIQYAGTETWYIYDTNYPSLYLYYKVKNTQEYVDRTYIRAIGQKSGKEIGVYFIRKNSATGAIGTDTSNIYGNIVETFGKPKRVIGSISKKILSIAPSIKEPLTYILSQHINIHLVGATFKKLIDTSTNKEVITSPYLGELLPTKAYQQNNNLFSNQIFLPKDKTYKVIVEKDKNFPFIKIFTTIPDKNGGVELIHYDNIEADENDSTVATFTIGINNKNKTLLRDDGKEMLPSYEESFRLKLGSATNANAIVKPEGVLLSWKNPDNPNFKEVVIVRKEDNASTSVSDGEEVYRGSGEKFTDANIDGDASYVYSIYAHDLNGDYAGSTTLYVDTYRYSLYGTVLDESGNAVSGARVTLNAQSGRFIDIASTDAQGLFSFNGMNPGDYNLAFSHNYYTFSKADMNVTVADKSLKVDNVAEGKATLSMGMSQRLQAGEETDIAWSGLHIEDGSKVDITLDKNGTSKTIVSGVAFDAQHFNWMVESLEEDTNLTATVKVSLSSDPSVSAQRDVLILAKVKYAYDFDHNGKVDNADIQSVSSRWQTKIGDAQYKALYDVNKDGRIDIKDIMLVVHTKETL